MTDAAAVPESWQAAARAVAGGARRVLVVGATDTGKSTFCRWLLAQAPTPALLLDADPGQPGLGPPGCVALGSPETGMVERFVFLGVLEPIRRFQALVAAVRRLAATDRPLVVNTCGFIKGPGAALQRATLRAVRPDLVVCLDRRDESAGLRETLAAEAPLLPLPTSPEVRRKSRHVRAQWRAEALRRAFEDARERTVPRGALAPAPLLPLPDPWPPRLLCALADAAGEDRALALLLAAEGETLRLLTPADPADAARLRVGAVAVGEDWGTEAVPPQARP